MPDTWRSLRVHAVETAWNSRPGEAVVAAKTRPAEDVRRGSSCRLIARARSRDKENGMFASLGGFGLRFYATNALVAALAAATFVAGGTPAAAYQSWGLFGPVAAPQPEPLVVPHRPSKRDK